MYTKTSCKYNEFANDVQCNNFYHAFLEQWGGAGIYYYAQYRDEKTEDKIN